MSLLHALRHRLKLAFARDRYARERAEELRIHEAMRQELGSVRLIPPHQGMSGPSSRPDPFVLHPDQEPGPMRLPLTDWIRQDLAYAIRGLMRSPGFTAMVVMTLALGVGANGAMYSVLSGIFAAPIGVDDPDGLRRLYVASPEDLISGTPPGAFGQFSYPAFASIEARVGDLAGSRPGPTRTRLRCRGRARSRPWG